MNVQDYYQEVDAATSRAAPNIFAHELVSALILILCKVIISATNRDLTRMTAAVEATHHEIDVELMRMYHNEAA